MDRHYLSVDDLSNEELASLLDRAAKVKAQPGEVAEALRGRSVAMIFEKPSTRTRISFEIAIAQTGGHPVPLSSDELQLGRGETIEDTGRVLSRYVDAIVLRTFEQERLELLAGVATVPVVNALSDFEHPCQCLADLLTVRDLTVSFAAEGSSPASCSVSKRSSSMRPTATTRTFTTSTSASKRWPYSRSCAVWKAAFSSSSHASSIAPAGTSKRTS